MPEFIPDTTGTVHGLEWDDLADFTKGYIECLLFTSNASGTAMTEWFEPEVQRDLEEGHLDGVLPTDAGFSDLHPDAFDALQVDCIAFENAAHELLIEAYQRGYTRRLAGQDFWYTRNGHGVGFWDRLILETPGLWESFGSPRVDDPRWKDYAAVKDDNIGQKLTEIARKAGEVYISFEPDESSPTGYGYICYG